MASAVFLILGAIFMQGENAVQAFHWPTRPSGSNGMADFKITSTQNTAKENSTNSSFAITRTSAARISTRHGLSWRMEKDDRSGIPIEDYVWQPVGASNKFYVYSAYCHENCSSIWIIGATKRLKPDNVQCTVRYPNNVTLTGAGRVRIMREHHDLKYAACFIQCPLAVRKKPDSVSIVTRKQTGPTNHLRVVDTRKYDRTNRFKRIGICVKPLHYVYDKTVQLVEFMELNRILGMDHVTFYNSSISPATDCILRNYVVEGRATVLPWKDNFKSQKEIRTENMIAALNDCLYRNKHNFTYLAFLDMDEFIMPAHYETIQQLLETLNARHPSRRIGSYNFRNGFFYLQWRNDPTTNSSDDIYERNLITLLKTRRMQNVHAHKKRSKYIVKPTKVLQVGNHVVFDFAKDYSRLEVEPLDGILNHYRICEFGGNDCVSHKSLVDRTSLRYKGRLVAAVKHRWKELRRRCGIGEIHKPKDLVTAEISLQETPWFQ